MERGKSPTDYHAKQLVRPVIFYALVDDFDVLQPQLTYRLHQEAGFFAIAVKENEILSRSGDCQRDTGQAGAGADIDRTIIGQVRQYCQGIEEMMADDLLRIIDRSKIKFVVPFNK